MQWRLVASIERVSLIIFIIQSHFIPHAARTRLFANSNRHILAARGIKRYSLGKQKGDPNGNAD
jgi:hypothetical protein